MSEGTIRSLEPYQTRYRWVMLMLASMLYFCFSAVLRSIAPLITPVLRDLNISYSQMGVILGSWPLTYILVSLVAGTIIDRWGIKKSLFLGILVISLSASLRYFANGFAFMFLCVVLIGLGGPMISIGTPKTIATWFSGKERGKAVGIYMTAISLGDLFALSFTNSIIMPLTGYSWRRTFIFFGLLSFIAALAWWFLARDTKNAEDETASSIIKVFLIIIKLKNVKIILVLGFLCFAVAHGFTNWLPKILENSGLTPEMAGFAASIPVLAGVLAFLTIPRLTPPQLRGRIIALMNFLGAIFLILIALSSGATLISGLFFYGLLLRCAIPLLLLILMDLHEIGSRNIGAAAGMFFCISEIGGFAGPSLMGIIVDMTGEFILGIVIISVLSVMIGILALLIKTKHVLDK